MPKDRGRVERLPRPSRARVIAPVLLLVGWTANAMAAEPCGPVLARVVSVQGTVQLVRATGTSQAELDATLCAGDQLRVLDRSRAAVSLNNETTVRLDQGTTLTLGPPTQDNASPLAICSGALFVITRTPRRFRITTPFVNANVKGTEFLVEVERAAVPDQCALDAAVAPQVANNAGVARVTVYEGTVDLGEIELVSGETAVASDRGPAEKTIAVRSKDSATWTLHVPTILDYQSDAGTARSPATTQSPGDPYRSIRIAEALAALERSPVADAVRANTQRAGLLLMLGRLGDAKKLIQSILSGDPTERNQNMSDAHALAAIIAVVEDDKKVALDQADAAVRLDSASVAAWIARSYAQQAAFLISDSLASAQKADALIQPATVRYEETETPNPKRALALARLAEMYMANGDLNLSLIAANSALAANPQLARTQTIFGFTHLLRMDIKNAKLAFTRAVELDQSDPLPRLGMGLSKIREGDLEAGRLEIEIATVLSPENSLVRSYLGKAYYEENRTYLAGQQFDFAKERDRRDPTPYYYNAIRMLSDGNPIDALHEINGSITLNGNRSVYRSRLLLDDDMAARTTGVSNIYGELGFQKLTIVESAKAIAYHYGNEQAHRQLAIAYQDVPRHDITRVSESLQAQLRQPLTASPLPPQVTTNNLVVTRDTGPTQLGDNEFNLLFNRNRILLQLNTVAADHGVFGDQFIASALADNKAYALSQYHYEQTGFGINEQQKKDIVDLYFQTDFSPQSSLQLELKSTRFTLNQVFNSYDPDPEINSLVRTAEQSDSIRLGGRYSTSTSSDWIYTLAHENRDRSGFDIRFNTFVLHTVAESTIFELQHLWVRNSIQLLAGLRILRENELYDEGADVENNSTDAYFYGLLNVAPGLNLQGGFSFDNLVVDNSVFSTPLKRHRIAPKLALVWSINSATTIRFAALSSAKRELIGDQTIEPTQLAGFSQFFSGFDTLFGDRNATLSNRQCVGVDQKVSPDIFVGGEITTRRMAVPSLILGSDINWRENTAFWYFYQAHALSRERWFLPGWRLASSFELEFEEILRPAVLTGAEGIRSLRTYYFPFKLKGFSDEGWSFSFSTTYIKQNGVFQLDEGFPEFRKKINGWVTDISVSYRLKNRGGVISAGTRNIFSRKIDAFQTDSVNPRLTPTRLFFIKASFLF
jgi:tetratricopeptide (TPR) repeat protein